MKEYYSGVFLVAVDYLRLELPDIAKVAVYPATQYVQTTTNIVLYGSASLQILYYRKAIGKLLIGTPFTYLQKLRCCLICSMYFHDQMDLVIIIFWSPLQGD